MTTVDDSFISDDEEEYCPLCVEEMDISDKNFKPCPCGYQICQFCYNNIKQSPDLNGRCPGCRRLYDDNSVEYKTITTEEYKLQQLKREKREREKKQREKEKKENELANKKHLAGIRVVQKNLVYVTGLNPPCNPEDLHSILRSDRYFGRYGKIQKIVINKKSPAPGTSSHHHSNPGLVVYVTFARKEDASRCISDMDGSLLDGKVLRAAHGTTKYCSSYLRGHPCQNPNCMFLHEPGEEADSYTRKDLSTQQGIKMGMKRVSSSGHLDGTGSVSNDEEVEDDSHIPANTSQASGSAGSQPQPQPQSQGHTGFTKEDTKEPVLPVTAHWAKAANSSPAVNSNTPLANVSAFPTLGEVLKDKKEQVTTPTKASKKKKRDLVEDLDVTEEVDNKFMVDVSVSLNNLISKKGKLTVKFDEDYDSEPALPLFYFNKDLTRTVNPTTAAEKLNARKVVETHILRPIKNYHLSYQNRQIIQQQLLVQQQIQKMAMDSNQQQQLMLLQQLQKQLATPAQQNVPVMATGGPQTPQQFHQVPAHLPQQATQQAPPQSRAHVAGQTPTADNAIPVQGAPPGLGNTNSSSSQLLTQLMSGKR